MFNFWCHFRRIRIVLFVIYLSISLIIFFMFRSVSGFFLKLKPARFLSNLNKSRYLLIDFRKISTSSLKMSKTALVLLAEGAEEMETIISVDVLRRAGVQVTLAGLDGADKVKCSRDVVIHPDISLDEALKKTRVYDAVILPGGLGGSEKLCKSAVVGDLLKEQEGSGRIVAAICAAPTALKAHGIAVGKRVTSYPSKRGDMEGYQYVEGEQVVVDGNIVTSRGPGTAFAFGLALAEILVGKEKASQVEKGMMLVGY